MKLSLPVALPKGVYHRPKIDGTAHMRAVALDVRMHARAPPIRAGARDKRRPAAPLVTLEALTQPPLAPGDVVRAAPAHAKQKAGEDALLEVT